MRVITGSARGRKLAAPRGMDTRPTAEVVKEAVFSVIQFEVAGARVLDLFAGSGQMGIEALSRGANSCALVDSSKVCAALIRDNLERTGLGERAKVYCSDAEGFLRTTPLVFDIAFLDPPYAAGLADRALRLVAEHMSEGGAILCESAQGTQLPERVGEFALKKQYRYGKTGVALYRHESAE